MAKLQIGLLKKNYILLEVKKISKNKLILDYTKGGVLNEMIKNINVKIANNTKNQLALYSSVI